MLHALQNDIIAKLAICLLGILLSLSLIMICKRKYEITIIIVVLSPVISNLLNLLFYNTNPENFREETIGSYVRIWILIIAGAVGLIQFICNRNLKIKPLPIEIVAFGSFIIFSIVSILFSIDPFYTAIRSMSFLLFYLFLLSLYFWLIDDNNINSLLNIFLSITLLLTIINLVSLLIFGDRVWLDGYGGRFQGLWDHPNTMGCFAMISYPILYWKYRQCTIAGKAILCIFILSLFVMHYFTGSRSTILLALFGIVLWHTILKQKLILLKFAVISIVLLSVITLIYKDNSIDDRFSRNTDSGTSITTLTGREEFWSGALTLFSERPLTGYGYGVSGKVWRDPRFNDANLFLWSGSVRTSLHNGFLNEIIGLGIIGFFILCFVIINPILKAMKLPNNIYTALYLTVIYLSLILNMFETITVSSSYIGILFWIYWVIIVRIGKNSYNRIPYSYNAI